MNHELVLTNCSKEQIFRIKQACLLIAKASIPTQKASRIKKPEIWARTICIRAVRDTLPNYSSFPFPRLPPNTRKVLTNKLWQLNQVLPPPSSD